MDKIDSEVFDLFTRYSEWLKINNLNDTLNNYRLYYLYIEKVNFEYVN